MEGVLLDFSKLGQGHRIAAGAGALLFIDLFLNWYSLNVSDVQEAQAKAAGVELPNFAVSGWTAFDFTDILLALVAVLAVAAALQSLGLLTLPVRLSSILLPAAGLMTLWLLYRLFQQPGPNDQVNNEYGAYIGFVLTALVAYGAMSAQSEPESVGEARVNTEAAGGGAPAATTPPPAATTTAPPATGTTAPPPAAPPADPPPPPAGGPTV
jgi:hypothetical protein